jgi:hypothetical protein
MNALEADHTKVGLQRHEQDVPVFRHRFRGPSERGYRAIVAKTGQTWEHDSLTPAPIPHNLKTSFAGAAIGRHDGT